MILLSQSLSQIYNSMIPKLASTYSATYFLDTPTFFWAEQDRDKYNQFTIAPEIQVLKTKPERRSVFVKRYSLSNSTQKKKPLY